jgi:hypothetical protein
MAGTPDPLRSLAHSVQNHAVAAERNILKGDLRMAESHTALMLQEGAELRQMIAQTRQNEGDNPS